VGRFLHRPRRYWLQVEAADASALNRSTWLTWIGIALLATLLARWPSPA